MCKGTQQALDDGFDVAMFIDDTKAIRTLHTTVLRRLRHSLVIRYRSRRPMTSRLVSGPLVFTNIKVVSQSVHSSSGIGLDDR